MKYDPVDFVETFMFVTSLVVSVIGTLFLMAVAISCLPNPSSTGTPLAELLPKWAIILIAVITFISIRSIKY